MAWPYIGKRSEQVRDRARWREYGMESNAGWNLATKKRFSRKNYSLEGFNRSAGRISVVSVFLDNLTEDMDAEWLGQIFSKFGHVIDVFLPKKRSKSFNSKFGFVRYCSKIEAEEAIFALNGISIRGKKILVKLAAYGVELGNNSNDSNLPPYKVANQNQKRVDIDNGAAVGTSFLGNNNHLGGRSYAQVVAGKPSHIVKRISTKPYNEWLNRSVVARLNSLGTMESILEALHCNGVPEVEVKDMGGLWVILTFPSPELMLSLFDGGELSWMSRWFAEVHKWSPELPNIRRRNVWISCYGVPLHGWSALTFQKIGQLWGEVITMDEATIKGLSYAAGKVMIATEKWDRINEVILVEVKGKEFEVRAIEEQVVIQGHCSFCNVQPSEPSFEPQRVEDASSVGDSKNVSVGEPNNYSVGNSENESVDEEASRRDGDHGDWLPRVVQCNSSKLVISNGSFVPESVVNMAADVSIGVVPFGVPRLFPNTQEESIEEGEIKEVSGPSKNHCDPLPSTGSGPGPGETFVFKCLPSLVGPSATPEPIKDNEPIPLILSELAGLNSDACKNTSGGLKFATKSRSKMDSKKKSWEDIFRSHNSGVCSHIGGRRRRKMKQVVFRLAAAAASLSISSDGIRNKNRILMDEAQAIWTMGKVLEGKATGSEDEIVSKLVEIVDDHQKKMVEKRDGIQT
ncbi:hypothetical protein Vadar_003897 [Vaccinium darrowii]|uniref:Uncharacterized protein n=1 Tax=Vaccinium darrowii TaxID=229202 RepID=A0ACB7WXV0_9ERIC|nr:hypothetical protein Vadar_003897 [Vaccinium darrowii]